LGYAPHGITLLIETATDNNRTVANVRSYFNKCNGTMGTQGSVEFMFDHTCNFKFQQTVLILKLELIDFGAEEVFEDEDGILIYALQFWNYQKSLKIVILKSFLLVLKEFLKSLKKQKLKWLM
jgi:transcriptional/translational regulatory protein YebC/TACO1